MPLDKDYNSAFFGSDCSRDNALDLNLVLSRIMHYAVLGFHSAVKDVRTYKVRMTASEQCLQLGQSWFPAKLHPKPIDTLIVCPDRFKMAKNNRQKSKNNKQPSAKPTGKDSNKQPSGKPTGRPSDRQPSTKPTGKPSSKQPPAKPTSKPPKCEICGKLHNGKSYPFHLRCFNPSRFTNREAGECRHANAPTRPITNCSQCGKKGHDEKACYQKNLSKKPQSFSSTPFGEKRKLVKRKGRWEGPLNCQRERDHSAVSFPLTLAGPLMKYPPGGSCPSDDAWVEDCDNDAIMCLHDCGEFCIKRFAVKCAKQLKQRTREQLEQGVIKPKEIPLVISQRDEEGIWQTMINYGTPNNSFGESSLMDIDEVL